MKSVLALLVFAVAAQAHAYTFEQTGCNGVELSVAENALQRAEGYFEVGAATKGDLTVAQMNLAETKLCASRNPGEKVDAQTCADLLKLQSAVVDFKTIEVNVGLVTVDERDEALVKQSKLIQFCSK